MFGYKMSDYDKRVYEEELIEFLPKNIVDSHTHVWEKSANIDTGKPKYWPSRVAEDCSIEDLTETFNSLFPENTVKPVIFGFPESTDLVKCNEYCAKVGKEKNLPTLFLTHHDYSSEYLEEQVINGGFQGLKPYFCNCKKGVIGADAGIYDYLPHEHLRVADKLGLKVILHISKPDRLKNPQNVKDLMDIEQKYPNVKLIVAHIGRAYVESDLGDAFETLKHSKNMFFDFCANTLPLATRQCVEAVGAKRLLYGTDMPIAKMKMYRIDENGYYVNVVPRGSLGDLTGAAHMRESDEQNITNFAYETIRGFIKTARDLSLTKRDIEDVFCNNATKLYDIKF